MADYSFLKPLFGADGSTALNFDQFSAALDAQKEIKVGNLADGSYVAKGKFDALVTERDTLKSSKEEADKKLAGYDPEWKTKADAAQAEADAKVNAILLKNAAMGALKDAGCKDPYLAFMALDASKLKLDGDVIADGAFVGDGCAISQASADIMLGMILGKKKEEALKMGETFLKMIKGEATEEEIDSLEEASALRDIAHMPARVKCAVLGWRTLKEALCPEEKAQS